MSEYISNGESALSVRNKLNSGLITPAEFSYSGNVVNITAPENAKYIEFTATVAYDSSYTYNLNGSNVTIKNFFTYNDSVYWNINSVVIGYVKENILYIISAPQKASKEETAAGTDDNKFVTPKNLMLSIKDSDKASNFGWVKIQKYTSAGSYEWTVPDLLGNRKSYTIGVLIVGAGGSGGACSSKYSAPKATGGASGYIEYFTKVVSVGERFSVVVGKGGAKKVANGENLNGENGGSSSFNGIVVEGGGGGKAESFNYENDKGSYGGQPSAEVNNTIPEDLNEYAGKYGGDFSNMGIAVENLDMKKSFPWKCFNPFENTPMLGAGSGAAVIGGKATGIVNAESNPSTKLGGGYGNGVYKGQAVAQDGQESGSGGGGAASAGSSSYNTAGEIYQATSGAGADGAVLIYAFRNEVVQ